MLGEETDGGSGADAVGFRDIDVVTSIMLHCWHDIESNSTMISKRSTFVGRFMDDGFATWWGERSAIVVKVAPNLIVSRDPGIDS